MSESESAVAVAPCDGIVGVTVGFVDASPDEAANAVSDAVSDAPGKKARRGPLTLQQRLDDMRAVQVRRVERLRIAEKKLSEELAAFRTSLAEAEAELLRLDAARGQHG